MAERAAGTLQRHVMRRQTVGGAASIYTSEVADPETAYPDLLELAPYSGGGGGGGGGDGGGSGSFCTLPRRRTGGSGGGVGSRYRAAGSDSQSPLLPGSRYGSDASSESYYPAMSASGAAAGGGLSGGMGGPPAHARSSFNLASVASTPASAPSPVPAGAGGGGGSAQPAGGPRPKNPSVPSSPSATPLLNLGAAAAVDLFPNAYDYHATQLERFLEEYRSLQEQLNKMKASIRHDPSPAGARSPPAVPTAGVGDPPPYWLPRRFSGGDFFES